MSSPIAAPETTVPRALRPPPGAAPTQRRGFGRALRGIVLFSLAVTLCAAVVALVVALMTGARFTLAFVVLRWCIVGTLLATPLVHQIASRRGANWQLPWALRTPATALLLTCESVAFDIASAHLG